jgi:hypothetical protein
MTIERSEQLYMVFDVESVGLHGEGFAVGWTVVDETGKEESFGCAYCDHETAEGTPEDREWVKANVALPSVPTGKSRDEEGSILVWDRPYMVRLDFWNTWELYQSHGALLVSDCAWPVETNFLEKGYMERQWQHEGRGPYPLIDVSSVLLAIGENPVGTFDRLPHELPAHNPLNDARQSARVFIAALHHNEYPGCLASALHSAAKKETDSE